MDSSINFCLNQHMNMMMDKIQDHNELNQERTFLFEFFEFEINDF